MEKHKNWFKRHPVWTSIIGVFILLVIVWIFSSNTSLNEGASNQNLIGSQSSSLTNPSSIGESLTTTLGVGQLVTAEYAVLEIIRGDSAWNKIKLANIYNREPEQNKEYILAKIRFKLIETSDGKGYKIPHTIFSVFSKNGVAYDYSSVIEPEPRLLSKELYSGATYEGWVAFEVSKEDTEPVLRVSYPGVTEELWFKLYPPITINEEEQSDTQNNQEGDLLNNIKQREEYPYFVPRLEKECNLIFSDLNVEIVKDNANYSGTSIISGKLTNDNPTPMFDVRIGYGLYSEKGIFLTFESINFEGYSSFIDLEPNETISFSQEKVDYEWSKPGIIYNAFAYRIQTHGQEPDLDSQWCNSVVGYAQVI